MIKLICDKCGEEHIRTNRRLGVMKEVYLSLSHSVLLCESCYKEYMKLIVDRGAERDAIIDKWLEEVK